MNRSNLQQISTHRWLFYKYATVGAVVMVLLIHPALEGMHRLTSRDDFSAPLLEITIRPILDSFDASMWPLTSVLGLVGALFGTVLASLHLRLLVYRGHDWNPHVTATSLKNLISEGESERLEFKSSLRWDRKLNKANKILEYVISKTIGGFMNHRGGTLLIGVEDDKTIQGIEADWKTLRYANWDGFEERLISLITNQIGAQHTGLVHSECVLLEKKPVAVIQVEPASVPVFCKDGPVHRYFLRAGNSTRKLDTQEAIAHIETRKILTS